MRRRPARLAVLAAVLGQAAIPSTAPASAIFGGPNLPTPPQQRADWTRPTTRLPLPLLDAVELLFAQGVADPRGGEYRAIEVGVGNCWTGDGGVVKTHGWVLPAVAGQTQTFAVCWNGLVYPVLSAGERADLAADVATTAAAPLLQFSHATPEAEAVAFGTPLPLKVAVLLRLGDAELAETLWPTVAASAARDPNGQQQPDDPYLALAREWCWYAFDSATCAHMWGNDVFSRDTAQRVADAVPQIEKAAAAKGFKPPLQFDRHRGPGPYIDFVGQLPALVEDQKRRVAAGDVPRVPDHPERYREKATRVAALVRDLEVVAARQWGQPGGVAVDDDPIVRAIAREGTAAIEPLLACLEHDDRLTRSVQFGRDFHRGRTLIPVRSAAFAALQNLLQARTFGPASDSMNRGGDADAKAIAAEIRAYVARTADKSPAERWLDTLADDDAGTKRWLEAAGSIVEPADVERRGGWVSVPNRKPGEVPTLKGEALRGRRDPSVSDLIAKRVPLVAAERDGSQFAQHDATKLALDLHAWDPAAAIPVAREQMLRCMRASDADRARFSSDPDRTRSSSTTELMAYCVGRLATALIGRGDEDGRKAYAGWIVTQTPAIAGSSSDELLQPLWRRPDDATLAAAAETLFNDVDSPWRCLPTSAGFREGRESIVATPAHYEVAAWRRHVLRNLDDTTAVGTAEVEDQHLIVRVGPSGSWSSGLPNPNDPLLPKPGDPPTTIRVCDWYATKLALVPGRPRCELYWPLADRDAARAALADRLRRWDETAPSR